MNNQTHTGRTVIPSRHLMTALVFSLGLALFVEHRIFLDPFALNDDIRNQIYWLARIVNPHLFPADYIANYFTQPLLIAPALLALYSSLAPWLAPLTLSQYLPLALVVIATFFLFKFCKAARNAEYASWVCYCFNISVWLVKNLSGGLPRAFIYPLLFALLWALQTRRWFLVTITLWLSALIYPPVLMLGLGILIVEIIRARGQKSDVIPRAQCLAVSFLGIIGIIGTRLGWSTAPTLYGPLTTDRIAQHMRDFYWGGRVVLYTMPYATEPGFPLNWVMPILQRLPHLYILIPVLVFGVLRLIYLRWFKRAIGPVKLPPLLGSCIIASLCMYILAWLFLFYLYVPERYLEYTLLILPGFMLPDLLLNARARLARHSRRITLGFLLFSITISSFFWRADLMHIPNREKQLYAHLKGLPAHSMMAAPPGLANNIPLFASQSVMLNNETYIPFHQAYFREMKSRLHDWLLAYYATDRQPVARLIQKYHLSYLVLQTADFKPGMLDKVEKKSYYAFPTPFFKALKQEDSSAYYLLRLPTSCITYQTRIFRVIDTKRCEFP